MIQQNKTEIVKDDFTYGMRYEDKEKVLFELGFIWGLANQLQPDAYTLACDSFEVIKNIIDKY